MQLKTTRYQFIATSMSKIKENDHTKCWGGHRVTGTLIHCCWEYKNTTALENHLKVSYKVKHVSTLLSSNSTARYLPKKNQSVIYVQECLWKHSL